MFGALEELARNVLLLVVGLIVTIIALVVIERRGLPRGRWLIGLVAVAVVATAIGATVWLTRSNSDQAQRTACRTFQLRAKSASVNALGGSSTALFDTLDGAITAAGETPDLSHDDYVLWSEAGKALGALASARMADPTADLTNSVETSTLAETMRAVTERCDAVED